jgi:hypothetical protein
MRERTFVTTRQAQRYGTGGSSGPHQAIVFSTECDGCAQAGNSENEFSGDKIASGWCGPDRYCHRAGMVRNGSATAFLVESGNCLRGTGRSIGRRATGEIIRDNPAAWAARVSMAEAWPLRRDSAWRPSGGCVRP